MAYYRCDFARTAMLAPSGNWYIPGTFEGDVDNTIIQKVSIMDLSSSEWIALYDSVIMTPSRMEESFGCELLVAAESKDNSLRLFKAGCDPF